MKEIVFSYSSVPPYYRNRTPNDSDWASKYICNCFSDECLDSPRKLWLVRLRQQHSHGRRPSWAVLLNLPIHNAQEDADSKVVHVPLKALGALIKSYSSMFCCCHCASHLFINHLVYVSVPCRCSEYLGKQTSNVIKLLGDTSSFTNSLRGSWF